jgi:poly(hydroxyalkanoate) depolymerase family esterase
MNTLSRSHMIEATRLTRAGRLVEAMALLRGGASPGPNDRSSADPRAAPPDALDRAAIDMAPPLHPEAPWTITTEADVDGENVSEKPRFGQNGFDAFREFRDRVGGIGASPLCGVASLRHASSRVPVPEGAAFVDREFSSGAGNRSYKLYIPRPRGEEPRPLIVMLHGCTQSPNDFALGTRMNEVAEERGFMVAYPAQPASANPQKCWNWFRAEDQARDRGEPAVLAGLTREIVAAFSVDPSRVFVAGLSAGGAAAAILGAAYPELYAAVGVHSGLAPGAASDMPSAFTAMRQGGRERGRGPSLRPVPTIVFHGDADKTVHPVNGEQVIARARESAVLAKTFVEGRTPDGLAYVKTVWTDALGEIVFEHWTLHGVGHAWSGGDSAGSYTEPRGPDASREMTRFFLERGSSRRD